MRPSSSTSSSSTCILAGPLASDRLLVGFEVMLHSHGHCKHAVEQPQSLTSSGGQPGRAAKEVAQTDSMMRKHLLRMWHGVDWGLIDCSSQTSHGVMPIHTSHTSPQ